MLAVCLVPGGVSSYFSVLVWMGLISGFPLRIVEFSIFALLGLLFFGSVLINKEPKALWGAILLVPAGYVNPFYVFDSSSVGVPAIGLLFGLPLLVIGVGAIFHILSGKLKKEEIEDERREQERRESRRGMVICANPFVGNEEGLANFARLLREKEDAERMKQKLCGFQPERK